MTKLNKSNLIRKSLLLISVTAGLLTACAQTSPTTSLSPQYGYASPSASPTSSPSLASLLTGQIVNSEEQQLRDIKNRKILLDFPLKVGVVIYNLNTRLEEADLKAQFDLLRADLKKGGQVRETIQIPNSLISGQLTIEELRKQGARFQCDVMILITGSHNFDRSKTQSTGFFDSFSNKVNYESKVKLDAIALDVYTGTLLSPFDAAVTGKSTALDRSAGDFSAASYTYQKETEAKAWESLRGEAVSNLDQLKADVDKRKEEIAKAGQNPSPIPTATPSPVASPVATPAPTATPAA